MSSQSSSATKKKPSSPRIGEGFRLTSRRKECYQLTEKGVGLIPVLVEMANWSLDHDSLVPANPQWLAKVRSDREGLYELIRNTVLAGGSVLCGEHSVIEQLARGA